MLSQLIFPDVLPLSHVATATNIFFATPITLRKPFVLPHKYGPNRDVYGPETQMPHLKVIHLMISLYMKGYFSTHLMSYTTHNSCTWLVKPATSIPIRMNLKYERGLVGPVMYLMNCQKLSEASTRNEVNIVELAQDAKKNQRPGIISEVSKSCQITQI